MACNFSRTKKIIISAMFLALAIIIGRFRIVIPGLFRIIFNGPFYKFIAIIFGPIYGTIISFLTETIGVILNPVGNYIWLFSIVTALRGFFIGYLWQITCKKKFALIISIAIPDFIASFLNTLIMKYYLLWPQKTFFIMLGIRLFKETILIAINIFILSVMLDTYKKIIDKGEKEYEF